MTGESILVIFNQLVRQYGGHIDKRKNLTKGNREAYTYILKSKKKVLNLLLDIQYYLVVKAKQAELLNTFCNLPSSHSRYKNYDVEIVRIKNELYDSLKRLKQPEPLAETKWVNGRKAEAIVRSMPYTKRYRDWQKWPVPPQGE